MIPAPRSIVLAVRGRLVATERERGRGMICQWQMETSPGRPHGEGMRFEVLIPEGTFDEGAPHAEVSMCVATLAGEALHRDIEEATCKFAGLELQVMAARKAIEAGDLEGAREALKEIP